MAERWQTIAQAEVGIIAFQLGFQDIRLGPDGPVLIPGQPFPDAVEELVAAFPARFVGRPPDSYSLSLLAHVMREALSWRTQTRC